jgi:2-octaprenyl-6-methoxyphenol hydroxylase
MSDVSHFDVAVVGGGLSGSLMALAAADADFSVALIDAAPIEAINADAYDGRTTAISFACARMLRRLGVWRALDAVASPINDILVTDGSLAGRGRKGRVAASFLHFDSSELEEENPLGWIVENRHLRRAIYDALNSQKGARIFAPAARRSTAFKSDHVDISLADDRRIAASLVIAADGKNSPLRAELGIKTTKWDYDQTAIIATIGHSRPHDGVAQELFLPAGPFAVLPMTDADKGVHRSSIVWTEAKKAAPAFLALDDEGFLSALRQRLGDYLGDLSMEGPRGAYPLSLHMAQRMIAPRAALIGDAARAIHPIAGQGYNLGLKDIAALTDVITSARDVGLDIGAETSLVRFETWRRSDATMLALGTDGLNRLFSNALPPVQAARRIGIAAVNASQPANRFFMNEAGANVGDLPSLMQA